MLPFCCDIDNNELILDAILCILAHYLSTAILDREDRFRAPVYPFMITDLHTE